MIRRRIECNRRSRHTHPHFGVFLGMPTRPAWPQIYVVMKAGLRRSSPNHVESPIRSMSRYIHAAVQQLERDVARSPAGVERPNFLRLPPDNAQDSIQIGFQLFLNPPVCYASLAAVIERRNLRVKLPVRLGDLLVL